MLLFLENGPSLSRNLIVMSVYVQEIPLVTKKSSRSGILFPSVRGGADKSSARPGRKQFTTIKLGIYTRHEAQCTS